MIKKIILAVLALAPLSALAQGFVPLAQIPGLTDANSLSVANATNLASFFNNLYKYAIGAAATLAVIEIIWGGLEISTKDSVSKNQNGKERIQNAIFGLVLVLSPALVFSLINPAILNLSLNLKPLDTRSGAQVGPGQPGTGVGTTQATDPSSGCVVNGVSGILQIAVCPSDAAARTWGQGCNQALDALSSITQISRADQASGLVSSKSVVTCTARQLSYVFINTARTNRAINSIQPLVRTSARPSNASNAISFASICQSSGLGWKTCISDIPGTITARRVDCQLTTSDPSYGTAWRCYEENLSCEDKNIVLNNQICADGPEWAPFQ